MRFCVLVTIGHKKRFIPKIDPLYRRHIQKYRFIIGVDSCDESIQSKFNKSTTQGVKTMQNIIVKITFWTQSLLIAFLLGKFSYGIAPDSDGFGVFIPNLGGYHVSLINDEDSGFYQ